MTARLTDQQRDAAHTIGADLCVDAGAGSGKTTVLVERVMHLLDQGVALGRIVAITFTRKAAAEMKERLRDAIHHRPGNDPRSMDKWRALELDVQTARISTIDGFCAALLHEHALHLGLDPDFVTLSEDEAQLLRMETAETTLAALLDEGEGPAQRLVVEYGLARVTDFLAHTLNQAARFYAAADSYAGLDAARLAAAWAEQAERLQQLREQELAASPALAGLLAELSAYEGQCSDRADKAEIALREALRCMRLITGPKSAASIRDGVAGLSNVKLRGGRAAAWPSGDAIEHMKAIVTDARDLARKYLPFACDPAAELAAAQLTLDLIGVFHETNEAYSEAKRAQTALDFADLLSLTVTLLKTQPELRARIAGGIEHLLIDEFQDTNHAQLDLAMQLTVNGAAKLFVVGDAKQSIYRFRGAEVDVFAEAKQQTRKTCRLDENFRSHTPLIEFFNDFFRDSSLLARVEPDFIRLTAARPAPDTVHVEFLLTDDPAEKKDDEEADEPRTAEAALIAGRIAEICGPGGVSIFDKERNAPRPACFGDVAVLYRATTHAGVYEEALRRLNIPANVIAGAGFYARQEILDLHNLFTLALDPWNEPALAAFLRSPLAGVTDDTLLRLRRQATLARAFWGSRATGNTAEDTILQRARHLVAFVQARREWPVPALVRALLAETGLEAILLAQHHGVQKAGNIHKLVHLAREYGGSGRMGLHAFTDRLSTLARGGLRAGDAELLSETGGAVTLMTVHNAKGLEFPIVVIADMGRAPGGGRDAPFCLVHPQHGLVSVTHDPDGEPAWPALGQHLKTLDTDDERAEEARMLYVAMTRARDRLLLAGPSKPKQHAWMAPLSAAYDLQSRLHGDTITGAAWIARVVRQATTTPVKSAEETGPVIPPATTLHEQAQDLPPTPGHVMPVRALLDVIHPPQGETSDRGPAGGARLDQRRLGTAAHALLERWSFGEDAPIATVAQEFFPAAGPRDACAQALEEMIGRLKRSPLWPRLTGATTLERELPFLMDLNGTVINGVIDAWLNGETLVDYKLSRPNPEKIQRHEDQLRVYAGAVRASTGRVPSEAFLYYLDSGELVPVAAGDAAVDALLTRAGAALRAHSPKISEPANGPGV